jgi:CspA family cold shock protein
MAQGKVKWFDTKKGYGFNEPDDGTKDAFLHISALQASNISSIDEGDIITYELTEQRGKMSASDVVKL